MHIKYLIIYCHLSYLYAVGGVPLITGKLLCTSYRQVRDWSTHVWLMAELWVYCWNQDREQETPASSEWSQLCTFQDIWEHSCREASAPVHLRLSSRMVPVPGPKKASPWATIASPQPNWWHTTWASGRSHASSHTVPHPESEYSSTRPSHRCWPPTSLSIPLKNIGGNSV